MATDGRNRTRWELTDNLLSNTFKEYRSAMYNYHRLGLDTMVKDRKGGKDVISASIRQFEILAGRRPNALLTQTFFDAKADEIQQIFSGGPMVNTSSLVQILNKVAPIHADKWQRIKP